MMREEEKQWARRSLGHGNSSEMRTGKQAPPSLTQSECQHDASHGAAEVEVERVDVSRRCSVLQQEFSKLSLNF